MRPRGPVGSKSRSGKAGPLLLNRQDYRRAGFSYLEVVVASLLTAVALVPALDALNNAMRSASANVDTTEAHFHVISLLEEVLAEPYSNLDAEALTVGGPTIATAYSDTIGSARRRLVYLARYDGDNADADGNRFTGGDDGLLWVRVALENTDRSIQTLTAR